MAAHITDSKDNRGGWLFKKVDQETFFWCYEQWRVGKMNMADFGKRCGISQGSVNKRIKYIFEHNGVVPRDWFYNAETHNVGWDWDGASK